MLVLSNVSGCGDSETQSPATVEQSATVIDAASTESSEHLAYGCRFATEYSPQPKSAITNDRTKCGWMMTATGLLDVFHTTSSLIIPLSVASNGQPLGGMQSATTSSTPSPQRSTSAETSLPVTTLPLAAAPTDNGWSSVFAGCRLGIRSEGSSEFPESEVAIGWQLQLLRHYDSSESGYCCVTGRNCR